MKWGNWLIGVCCALFVAVIVTPTGVYEGVWKLATGKDAAAWVQAIGSIGAIGAGFGFAQLQIASVAKEARRAENRRAAAKLRAASMTLKIAYSVAKEWFEAIEKAVDKRAYAQETLKSGVYEMARDLLEEIAMGDIDVPVAFDSIYAARSVLEDMMIVIRLVAAGENFQSDRAQEIVARLELLFAKTAQLSVKFDPEWFD